MAYQSWHISYGILVMAYIVMAGARRTHWAAAACSARSSASACSSGTLRARSTVAGRRAPSGSSSCRRRRRARARRTYIVMAHTVMALYSYGPCSYGVCSYGRYGLAVPAAVDRAPLQPVAARHAARRPRRRLPLAVVEPAAAAVRRRARVDDGRHAQVSLRAITMHGP